jgi:Tol biopolymer transport system component
MKSKTAIALIGIVVATLILASCVPLPPSAAPAAPAAPTAQAPAPAATGAVPSEPVSEWQLYTDAAVGFSIRTPADWTHESLPDQNNGAIHGMAFTGPEGGVEVYWGVGFGGACPGGTVPVRLAQAEVPACHATNADGTEVWSQIGYQVSGGNSFSVRAYTSNSQPASHDLVLEALATLTFMAPAQPQAEAATPAPTAGASIANPASVNCTEQGGTLAIEERGDGGQFGVCYFEDNMQCEEWALMRGDCPVGGLKVTGYVTPAARYCAITGGQYAVTGKSGANDEQGTCTFKDGSQCDAWDYYNGTCAASAGAEAASPGGAGLLVFDSTRGGEYRDLWVMSVDGTPPTRLTEGEANNFAGPWSPDGTRVVYTCGGLTTSDICIVNADGTGMLNLTDTPNVDEGFPAWSPDGEKIAFTTRRDGNNEIYEMPAPAPGASAAAASSKWVRLTDNPTDDFAPAWSPDGSQIAFVSDRDRKAGIYDIYIMQADGSGVRRLTADTAIDYSPAWSPDGKMIAFRSHHDGPADIYLIGVDGAGLHDLTNNPADDWAPQWSPDGTLIAFQTNRDGDWEIYTIHPDGSNSVNLTNDPAADDQLPFWRP